MQSSFLWIFFLHSYLCQFFLQKRYSQLNFISQSWDGLSGDILKELWKTNKVAGNWLEAFMVSNLRRYLVGGIGWNLHGYMHLAMYDSTNPITLQVFWLVVPSLSINCFKKAKETFGTKFMKLGGMLESSHSDVLFTHCWGFCGFPHTFRYGIMIMFVWTTFCNACLVFAFQLSYNHSLGCFRVLHYLL